MVGATGIIIEAVVVVKGAAGVGTEYDRPDCLADQSATEALHRHQELQKPLRLLSPAKHLLTIPYIVYIVFD